MNKDKMIMKVDAISFMGHQITEEGLKVDPSKVKAIKHAPAPKNVGEIRSFLGAVNYLSRFVPHMSEEIHTLHNLLKKDVLWNWSSAQQKAFDNIKNKIADCTTLVFYDPSRELTLQNDASEYGIGSVIMQDGKPIAFASRRPSDAERNYAQI